MAISTERNRSFMVFTVCGTAVVLFIAVILYPRYKLLIQKEIYIIELKHRIADQKELIPQLAMKIQETEQVKMPEELLVPKKVPLRPEESERLPLMLEELALRYHLKAETIVAEHDSVGEAVFLSLNTTRQNDKDNFSELYHFLMELEKTSYMERIERISIRAVNDIKKVDIRIRIVRK